MKEGQHILGQLGDYEFLPGCFIDCVIKIAAVIGVIAIAVVIVWKSNTRAKGGRRGFPIDPPSEDEPDRNS